MIESCISARFRKQHLIFETYKTSWPIDLVYACNKSLRIWLWTVQDTNLYQIPNCLMITSFSDLTTPKLNFTKNFSTRFPDRNFYKQTPDPLLSISNKWFTEGSKTSEGTESVIYGPNHKTAIGFDNFASVFQTEVIAISFCAVTILSKNPKGQKFSIFWDSNRSPLRPTHKLHNCTPMRKTI